MGAFKRHTYFRKNRIGKEIFRLWCFLEGFEEYWHILKYFFREPNLIL
jgi:hypothetical protein